MFIGRQRLGKVVPTEMNARNNRRAVFSMSSAQRTLRRRGKYVTSITESLYFKTV
jgi:hypothetical protein